MFAIVNLVLNLNEASSEKLKTNDSYQSIELISGTYTLENSGNFDSYLKELGIRD